MLKRWGTWPSLYIVLIHADTPYLNKPIQHVSNSSRDNGLNLPFSLGKPPR